MQHPGRDIAKELIRKSTAQFSYPTMLVLCNHRLDFKSANFGEQLRAMFSESQTSLARSSSKILRKWFFKHIFRVLAKHDSSLQYRYHGLVVHSTMIPILIQSFIYLEINWNEAEEQITFYFQQIGAFSADRLLQRQVRDEAAPGQRRRWVWLGQEAEAGSAGRRNRKWGSTGWRRRSGRGCCLTSPVSFCYLLMIWLFRKHILS